MLDIEIIHNVEIGWDGLDVMSYWSDDKDGSDDNITNGSIVVEKDYW